MCRQREARPTNAIALVHATEPTATSAHIVGAMTGKSTSAPKMHIEAAPASKNAPGKSSQAEYHGGCTRSPRSKCRAAKNRKTPATTAGAVSCAAHPGPIDPVAAPMTGCTPASVNAAGTANASNRRSLLAGGIDSAPSAGQRNQVAGTIGICAGRVKTGWVGTQPYLTSR